MERVSRRGLSTIPLEKGQDRTCGGILKQSIQYKFQNALLSCEGQEQFWRCAGSPGSASGRGMAVTPTVARAHTCHPEELSSFGRVLGVAMLGPQSPSAVESEKTSPPNCRLVPKILSARFRMFCGRDFVTELGGSP